VLGDRVVLTKDFAPFCIETLPLQILLTKRAVEALGVIVVIESLHPAVARLDGEPAGDALGGEQLVPVLLTVGQPVLQVEGRVSEDLAAVGAGETLGVEVVSHRFQAVLLFQVRRSQPGSAWPGLARAGLV